MQRIKFIHNTLTGFPIALLAPVLLASSCKKEEVVEPNGKTVIVVGAGISGLAAAKKLNEKGFKVIIFEAIASTSWLHFHYVWLIVFAAFFRE